MNRFTFEQIKVGDQQSFEAEVTQQKMDAFRQLSGDVNPLHCDPGYAKAKGYTGCVAYGMLTASFLSTMAGVYLPGERSLIHSVEIKMLKPVMIGDRLTISGTVKEMNDIFQFLILKVLISNQQGETVARATMQVGVTSAVSL